jgi:glycosyltransferase involved in cell wall biosynthesis
MMPNATPNQSGDLTVVVILHDDPPHIRQVVECVLAQDYVDGVITILCLDDGTSPNARQLLQAMKVVLVDLPPSCSLSVAKNTALRIARDPFVFFLDDHICMEAGGITAAMRTARENPRLAGVCGFYRSEKDSDWNLLRDIKRHSIYGKSVTSRAITLGDFTTFSTGFGLVRRDVFAALDFPVDVFPPDFGGEDIPALITALNHGYEFAYLATLRGVHGHNLSWWQFLKKMEVEIRGRYSVFYWASGYATFDVPYLHGFLNFPLFLYFSFPLAIALSFWSPLALCMPLAFLAYECVLSLRCLFTPIRYRIRHRLLAACYVLVSDLLTPLCGIQYVLSSHKRPYRRLGLRRTISLFHLFLKWELAKFGLYQPRRRARETMTPFPLPHWSEHAPVTSHSPDAPA